MDAAARSRLHRAAKDKSGAPTPAKPTTSNTTIAPPGNGNEIKDNPPTAQPTMHDFDEDLEDKELESRIAAALHKTLEPVYRKFDTIKENLSSELENVKKELNSVKQENEQLRMKMADLERYNKQKCIKIYGLRESTSTSSTETKQQVLNLLRYNNIPIHPKAIEQAYRVGVRESNYTRPIFIQFLHLEDKNFILSQKSRLQENGIKIEQAYTKAMEDRRKELKPVITAAIQINKSTGQNRYNAKLRDDKVIINNKSYTIENMNQLPAELRPQNIATPSKNGITAFFTKASPLSNHHLKKQEVHGKVFNTNEQYYMYKKAKQFGDHETAAAIMKTNNPAEQKRLGRDSNIKGFKKETWRDVCEEVMMTGLKAKFSQNDDLKQFLLNTGDNQLIECNPHDKFWGIGLSLKNPQIWTKNVWMPQAKNTLGKLLSWTRRELRLLATADAAHNS